MAEAARVVREMPDPRYAGLWDSIVVDGSVKERLLRGAVLNLRLRAELPFETTALHGLVLLYGPPGTGKTTLARGLAHELTKITTGRKARLIEIDPHGLMSAEHGESQRAVTQLLTEHVPSLADDGMPTVVLLDEVESMAIARSEASLAANPADVHRATDAVLAALDSNTVDFSNLVFVATSNFVCALDEAFLSRVDVHIRVPTPDSSGIVEILKTRAAFDGAGIRALRSAGLRSRTREGCGTHGGRGRTESPENHYRSDARTTRDGPGSGTDDDRRPYGGGVTRDGERGQTRRRCGGLT